MNERCKHIGKDGFRCGSCVFNLYMEDIDQGELCDVHYWQAKAQRTWVRLTDVEIDYLLVSTAGENEETHISFARAIEAKLKELNDHGI